MFVFGWWSCSLRTLPIDSKNDAGIGFILLSPTFLFFALFSRENLHNSRVRGVVIVCRDAAVNTNNKNIRPCRAYFLGEIIQEDGEYNGGTKSKGRDCWWVDSLSEKVSLRR